jgi:hypothetical protein
LGGGGQHRRHERAQFQSLAPVNIGYQRRTVALLGQFFASPSWTMFGEFRRQEKNGTELTSASFLTEALQLPQPIDYVTNSFETAVAWAGQQGQPAADLHRFLV